MQIAKVMGTWALVIAAAIILFGLYVQVEAYQMPDNAQVYLDAMRRTYTAPPCVRDTNGMIPSTIEDARALSYDPDAECRDTGAFSPAWISLFRLMLIKAGILTPVPSKWNADGSWNNA